MAKALDLPRALDQGRSTFARWRATKTTRKIPDQLWNLAVKLAKQFGVCCTAKVLNLDYNGLKSKMKGFSKPKIDEKFVELPIAPSAASTFEIQVTYPDGTQLHVGVQEASQQQMASLSALIWRS